ncbi:MAG: RimK family alpha-L-glutamate ligase [Halobacteriales archaeon]
MATSGTVTVGVLSLHNSKETKAILNAIEDLGHQPEWLREENLAVSIDDGATVLEPDVDLIANRLLLTNTEQPAESLGLAHTLENVVPMLNGTAGVSVAIHKFASAVKLADAGLPVPDAFLTLSADRLNRDRERFGEEAVYKTAIGTHGGGTWKVALSENINPKVGQRQAFLQEMIDHDEKRHHDLRVYVVGDRIVGAMNRYAPEGDWRTNVALGGDVEDATESMSDEIREMAVRAADTIGLDYAGVDIVQGTDGWYVLEVNPTAGFKGLFQATGRSAAPYIAQLAIERAGGEVDETRVQELSATLDDSVPACKPARPGRGSSSERQVIGYTEEIVVSGTTGSETVLAKSDTGASRTSIDTKIAAEIGAGPIKQMTRVKSGSVKSSKSRPVVDIVVGVGGERHTVSASIEDRSHMDYPVLLGRDILKNYQVDISRQVDDQESESEEE